ncbi:MAG TPA: aspartate ammonia-lyase [Pyrinomonadaceae bacterium]|nr:aspartate ammonia-lyase [Pyrinomonadaceae bacterium]
MSSICLDLKPEETTRYRTERDPLGEKRVPDDVLYGVQTLRALENFQISSLRMDHSLIIAFAEIKKAAAGAHLELGDLDAPIAHAIIQASEELIEGQWKEEFALDVFQAGAGTSYNMNVNEVIANRALEILGRARGDHEVIEPNDHVNKGQSTNDVMPTAMRIACIRGLRPLVEALRELEKSFKKKADEFAGIEKSGRTHLHDAVPMKLGDEFLGYAQNTRRATDRLASVEESLLEVPLGGTAVGTGTNTTPEYAELAVEKLRDIIGLPLRESKQKVALQQSLGDFMALSAGLSCLAVEVSKIANDLRLMNSGPHTGFDEIELAALQPGSSIMPGKVNPAVAEMLNMVSFHVLGHDTAITHCAQAGQLELNVMMPYVAYALLESLHVMRNAVATFDEKCVRLIKPHPEKMREYTERSVGVAALYNQERGFMGAAELAKKAIETGKSVKEIVEEE